MKSLKEKIKVMQAILDGVEVEFKLNIDDPDFPWEVIKNPEFNWDICDYRIKLKECYVTFINGTIPGICSDSKEYLEGIGIAAETKQKVIKMREVVE